MRALMAQAGRSCRSESTSARAPGRDARRVRSRAWPRRVTLEIPGSEQLVRVLSRIERLLYVQTVRRVAR